MVSTAEILTLSEILAQTQWYCEEKTVLSHYRVSLLNAYCITI